MDPSRLKYAYVIVFLFGVGEYTVFLNTVSVSFYLPGDKLHFFPKYLLP